MDSVIQTIRTEGDVVSSEEEIEAIYEQCKKFVDAYTFQDKLNRDGFFALEPVADMDDAIQELQRLTTNYVIGCGGEI